MRTEINRLNETLSQSNQQIQDLEARNQQIEKNHEKELSLLQNENLVLKEEKSREVTELREFIKQQTDFQLQERIEHLEDNLTHSKR